MGEWAVSLVYEDEDLVAVAKPSGLLSEGGGARERDLEAVTGELVGRPVWCCHRLDRLTSGIILLRKTGRFKAALAESFEKRKVRKEYWALVEGRWDRSLQKIETRIAPMGGGRWANVSTSGKPALSTVQLLGYHPVRGWSWLRLLLKTGRSHQARLHCLEGGCPVVGDPLYGRELSDGFFGLHARRLSLRHPGTKQPLTLEAPVSEQWARLLEGMGDQ